jgi:hypothetical protein
MPPKANPRNRVPAPDFRRTSTARQESGNPQYFPEPAGVMATEVQTSSFLLPSSYAPAGGGVRLPPILPYPSSSMSPGHSPTVVSPYGPPGGHSTPISARPFGLSLPVGTTLPLYKPTKLTDPSQPLSPAIASTISSPTGNEGQRGVKRLYEDAKIGSEGHVSVVSPQKAADVSRPDRAPTRGLLLNSQDLYDQRSRALTLPMGELGSVSSVSTPSGTTSSFPTLGNTFSRRQSESSIVSNTHRLSLYMRQEPRAARAGPDGRYVDLAKAFQMLTWF